MITGGGCERRLAGEVAESLLPGRVLLVVLRHGCSARGWGGVVVDWTRLSCEVSLQSPGQVTSWVTAWHWTLSPLYGWELGPGSEDVGGQGLATGLASVLLRVRVWVTADSVSSLASPGHVDTPLHLTSSGLLPGGGTIQLGTCLQFMSWYSL